MNEYEYRIPLFGPNYSNSWIVRIIRPNTAGEIAKSAVNTGEIDKSAVNTGEIDKSAVVTG